MNTIDMATLTASLERSLRNCSLNGSSPGGFATDSGRRRCHPSFISSSSDSSSESSTATLVELNSHISLPYHWEQCLDLKTGEIYYVNWRSGEKANEDPRLKATALVYNYSDEEGEDVAVDGSEGSSKEEYLSSSASSADNYRGAWKSQSFRNADDVLVVAGCKACLMYYMVPKQVEDCPKCTGHLFHLDRSSPSSSSSSSDDDDANVSTP